MFVPSSTIKILTVSRAATQFALIAATITPGGEPPCHRHLAEEELLYVLEGEIAVWIEGTWSPAAPDSPVCIPRGTNHTIAVTGRAARLLMVYSPAGFEAFYQHLRAETLWVPPETDDIERWVAAAARYGCEITGPHPGYPTPALTADAFIQG